MTPEESMEDLELECQGCGKCFRWTVKEQKEFVENAPEGQSLLDTEPYCKSCRPKQDQQRS
jgi:hypothetical protein